MGTKDQTVIEKDTTTKHLLGKPYNVIIFNDDHHNMMEVSAQIVKATGCSIERAINIMMEAHTNGRAICFTGNKERCELVEAILSEIGLGTKIEQV
jgi:ATP-dependent Clp protease adaptor protein ClpS